MIDHYKLKIFAEVYFYIETNDLKHKNKSIEYLKEYAKFMHVELKKGAKIPIKKAFKDFINCRLYNFAVYICNFAVYLTC